jgi:hypothetical protein
MKKFKDLLSEQIAADYKEKKDDEKEVKGYKPRSKGEEDFANMHTVDKVNHPVAEPDNTLVTVRVQRVTLAKITMVLRRRVKNFQ